MKLPGGPTVRQRSDRQTITLISGRTADFLNSANGERSICVTMKVKIVSFGIRYLVTLPALLSRFKIARYGIR